MDSSSCLPVCCTHMLSVPFLQSLLHYVHIIAWWVLSIFVFFLFYVNQRKILYVGLSAITTDTGPWLSHKRYGNWKHVNISKALSVGSKLLIWVWNNDMQYLLLSKNCSEKQFWPLHTMFCQQTERITLSLWPRASVHMAGFDLLFVFIQKLIESGGNCLEVAEIIINTKV